MKEEKRAPGPDDFVRYKGYTFTQAQYERYREAGDVDETQVQYFDPHEAIDKARAMIQERARQDAGLGDLLKRLFAFEDKVIDYYRLRHLK
ncbi:hypothetical protein [Taibaiella koreensis]|uniref:hypothetical protein n=1 Tax=Taibaiella koreensis TaxID=1268548 RepID=UPI000E5A0AEE|nr:hypothetical protein [Taibaiella koreensis]